MVHIVIRNARIGSLTITSPVTYYEHRSRWERLCDAFNPHNGLACELRWFAAVFLGLPMLGTGFLALVQYLRYTMS